MKCDELRDEIRCDETRDGMRCVFVVQVSHVVVASHVFLPRLQVRW